MMKKYEVGMNIYVELPRGKEYFIMRKIAIRAIKHGRYDGVITSDRGIHELELIQLYLSKPEMIFRSIFANRKMRVFVD